MASNFTNVFGEPASNEDLDHIFDVLNENNDDRIQYREFVKHTENCGFKASKEDTRNVFDHICTLSDNKVINKKAWIGGIEIAHENPLTRECYTKILTGGQYDPQPGRSEMNIDDITKTLKDLKADWRHRINCMESLCRQLTTTKSMNADKFHSIFRLNHVGLTKQARDRRSNVMRVACEVEAKLIRRWKKEFSKYGATLIEYIYELVRVKIKINNMMGKNVLICLVKHCPDSKKLRFLELLGKEANESKYQNLKKECFDILVIYFHHQTDSLKEDDSFWNLLMKITKKGVEDVDQIRNAALHLLAAIQVERHDLAFPIIKKMNDHLRKRYESEYQISRGSNRGKSPTKKKGSEYKQNDDYVSLPGTDSHARKHTWSTNDLIAGFAQMQQKRLSNVSITKQKKKEKSAKDRTKVKAKFPVPPDGQYFSPFGESVTEQDIAYAFEFVDVRNDHKITIDEMQIVCDKLDIDKAEKLFNYLDVSESDEVSLSDWKQALSQKKTGTKLREFWLKVLGGKALEESPKPHDYDLDDAVKILSNQANDQNARILALHSITRKMCMKLSVDKFHKLFKKCIGNITSHLFDRKAYVMREACICLGKIMIARRAQFVKFAERTLEALYEVIKINDDKRHFSAHQAAKVLIRFIPDSKKFPIFAIVTKGCTEKSFSLTRNSSFEYVNHILARMVQVDQSRNDRFWAYMDKILESGLNDSDQNVCDAAYSALAKTEVLRKDLASEYVKTLRKSAKDKYVGIKKHVLQNIQDEDFGAEGPGLLIALGHSTNSLSIGSDMGSPKKGQKSPKKLKAAITSDSRFTMTPMGFAELGAQYNANKQVRKSSHQIGGKKLKSPSTNRERMKNRSATVNQIDTKKSRRTNSNMSNGSSSGKKSKKKALTTDDYTPQRGRDRANSKRKTNRPKTARISKEKEKDKGSKKNRTNSNQLTRKKNKKPKIMQESIKDILATMSMADQARMALCITAHKALVQAFIEKTENLAGSIDFLQFRECLNRLNLDVGKGNALAAFSELDEDKMDSLDMEEFSHAVHVAFPTYDKLWKQLTRSKYRYYATLESLMAIEEIKAILSDKKLGWKLKTKAMRSACTICCDQKRSDIEITGVVKKLIDSFIVSLRSNNQLIVREACICIATMAKERNVCLKGVVGKLLKTCWELLDVKNELIKFSAAQCLKIVIKYVPDDMDNKYLKTLIQGTNLSDFGSVRQSCFECIIVMILRAGNPNNGPVGKDFWKRIQKVIIDGVQSEEQEVKDYAFQTLYAFEKCAPQKAHYLTEQFDDDIMREYNMATKDTSARSLFLSDTDSIKSDMIMSPDPIATGGYAEDDEKEIPQNPYAQDKVDEDVIVERTAPTPIPSNEALPSSLEERTAQIEEIYKKLDTETNGYLNRFKAMTFLKQLMNVNMRNAEIILSGLDLQNEDGKRGQFSKEMLTNWAYFHSPEMEPNPLLHEQAETMQWLTLRKEGLEQRKILYSKLLTLEKADKNYAIVYDLDSKICILNYLIGQC